MVGSRVGILYTVVEPDIENDIFEKRKLVVFRGFKRIEVLEGMVKKILGRNVPVSVGINRKTRLVPPVWMGNPVVVLDNNPLGLIVFDRPLIFVKKRIGVVFRTGINYVWVY